tara:strand:- start:203 stop:598 length:396 start_codon:yes stop_codon:yes gene_type:complete
MNFKTLILFISFLLAVSISTTLNAQVEGKTQKTNQFNNYNLKSSYVCYVTNRYMGTDQIPVEVEGKTYYGCCQGCVGNLKKNRKIRYAIDPLTGEEVDKALAYIVLKPRGGGAVLYFSSRENYLKYYKLKG